MSLVLGGKINNFFSRVGVYIAAESMWFATKSSPTVRCLNVMEIINDC